MPAKITIDWSILRGALGLLAALAALFPWELGEKADPFGSAPEGIKPEWYFLFMFQALKKLPPHFFNLHWLEGEVVGVLFFGICGLVVLVVPFLDFGAQRSRPRREARGTGFVTWTNSVTTGLQNDSLVEIVPAAGTDSVRAGEVVLTEGHYTLIHDARVRLADDVSGEGGRPD